LSQSTADRGKDTEDRGDENGAATSEVVVAGVANPAADESTSDIRSGIYQAHKQIVCPPVRTAFRVAFANPKLYWKGQICAV
jgi:hypothetical protein